jgi:hypothetical protein
MREHQVVARQSMVEMGSRKKMWRNLRSPKEAREMLVVKTAHHVIAEVGKTRYSSPARAELKGLRER